MMMTLLCVNAVDGVKASYFLPSVVRLLNLGRTYNATVMMFAILGYQVENDDVLAALGTVARHLRKGGLFAFDIWYGPGVLRDPPGERARAFHDGKREIIRIARGDLDVGRQLASVKYDLWSVENSGSVEKTSERHTMRFFFPKELELFLQIAGLRLVSLSAFGETDKAPTEKDWNVFAAAVRT